MGVKGQLAEVHFLTSILWVLGIELWAAGLAASPFPPCWAISLVHQQTPYLSLFFTQSIDSQKKKKKKKTLLTYFSLLCPDAIVIFFYRPDATKGTTKRERKQGLKEWELADITLSPTDSVDHDTSHPTNDTSASVIIPGHLTWNFWGMNKRSPSSPCLWLAPSCGVMLEAGPLSASVRYSHTHHGSLCYRHSQKP